MEQMKETIELYSPHECYTGQKLCVNPTPINSMEFKIGNLNNWLLRIDDEGKITISDEFKETQVDDLAKEFLNCLDQINALSFLRDKLQNEPKVPFSDKEIIAMAVALGRYGNAAERKERLEAEGWNHQEIQQIVNKNCGEWFKLFESHLKNLIL